MEKRRIFKCGVFAAIFVLAFAACPNSAEVEVEQGKQEETVAGPASSFAGQLLILQAGAAGSNGAIGRSFIELYNTTDAPIDLNTFSLQYAAGSSASLAWLSPEAAPWAVIPLTGTIPAAGSFLIVGNFVDNSANQRFTITDEEADLVVDGFRLSNRSFKLALMANQKKLTVANPFAMQGGTAADFVDMLGVINTSPGDGIDGFETAIAAVISQQASARRISLADTDNNSLDFEKIDYRWPPNQGPNTNADGISDEVFEQVRPRSSQYGAWMPFPPVPSVLPSLHLSIAPVEVGGTNSLDRNIWRPTTVSLRGDGIYQQFSFENLSAQARGRGNASWANSPKRPLRIRFPSGAARSMFGSDYAARDWTLIANALEHSMLRSYAAYFLGSLLDGLDFSPAGHFLHLYMDGEYRGVYMLSDQMHVHPGRVELAFNSDPALSEYFLEWCFRLPSEGAPHFTLREIHIPGYNHWRDIHFGFEFPGTANLSLAHRQFAESFVRQVDAALEAGNRAEVSNLIDIPSFIDFYLVQELFQNQDIGASSLFFQIRQTDTGPKLFAGPLWDFDRSSGFTDWSPQDPRRVWAAERNRFLRLLMNRDWFREMVGARWNQIRDNEVREMLARIEFLAEEYRDCFERNFVRWPDPPETWLSTPWHIVTQPFAGQVEYLFDWFGERMIWMDDFLP